MADERLARPARFLRDNEGDEDDGGLEYVLLVRFGRLVVFAIFVIITGIETVIVFYFSYVYKQSVVDKIPQMTPPTGNQGLKHGLFAGCCWNDCQTCLHVCCCPQARVAHTLTIAGLADYWPIVLLYMFLNLGGGPCCAVCVFSFYFRTNLKKQMGIEPNTMNDLCVACCCTACGQCQEALEVDDATGVHVSCCCQVQIDAAQASAVPVQVMGQPVET